MEIGSFVLTGMLSGFPSLHTPVWKLDALARLGRPGTTFCETLHDRRKPDYGKPCRNCRCEQSKAYLAEVVKKHDQRSRGHIKTPGPASLCLMLAQTGRLKVGRACPLCPGISDINLFRYCQGVIDLDAEIPDRAFDFRVPEQEQDSPQVARPPIDQVALVRRSECVPKSLGSSPMLPIQSETSRAYCRVIILRLVPRWPVNKNSSGRLPVAFR